MPIRSPRVPRKRPDDETGALRAPFDPRVVRSEGPILSATSGLNEDMSVFSEDFKMNVVMQSKTMATSGRGYAWDSD